MKIEICYKKDGEEKKEKVFEITKEQVIEKIAHLGVFSFVGREVNRIRPAKRNIGLIFNWITAAALTDAIMAVAFPKKVVEVREVKETEDDEA